MLTTKTRLAYSAIAGGLGLAAGLVTFSALSRKSKKPFVPALVAGGVVAAVGAAAALFDLYVLEKDLGAAAGQLDAAIGAGKDVLSGVGLIDAARTRTGLLSVQQQMGLLDVQQRMGLLDVRQQRMGLNMPAPTVKKFSSFTGTRFYS